MKTGDQLIAEERCRQVSVFNFDAAHDAEHKDNELLQAAQCYLNHVVERGWTVEAKGLAYYRAEDVPDDWPWNPTWWKPESPEKDMIKAAALIAAEYDRRNS